MSGWSSAPPRMRAALVGLLGITLVPMVALAHAVVYPRTSTPGTYEKYVLRVPNERNLPTTRVEIRFPADARVTSFADVSGWTLEILTDSAQRIVGAVWTGTLPPKHFVEFPFSAVNPGNEEQLVWPAYQTYGDGEKVAWTGAEGSDSPASVTAVAAAAEPAAPAPAVPAPSQTGTWLGGGALVLSLLSLGVSLRRTGPGQ